MSDRPSVAWLAERYVREHREASIHLGVEAFNREYEDEMTDLQDAVRIAIMVALDHYA